MLTKDQKQNPIGKVKPLKKRTKPKLNSKSKHESKPAPKTESKHAPKPEPKPKDESTLKAVLKTKLKPSRRQKHSEQPKQNEKRKHTAQRKNQKNSENKTEEQNPAVDKVKDVKFDEKLDKKTAAETIKFFISVLVSDSQAIFFMCLCILSLLLAMLLAPFGTNLIIAGIINDIATKGSALSGQGLLREFAPRIILYGGMSLGSGLMWRVCVLSIWQIQIKNYRRVYEKCFSKLVNQSAQFHNDRFAGSIVSATSKFANSFMNLTDMMVFDGLGLLASFVFVCVILGPKLPALAIAMVLIGILFLTVYGFSLKKIRQNMAESAEASNDMSGKLSDSITNIMGIKGYGQERFENQRYISSIKNWQRKERKVMWTMEWAETKYSLVWALMLVSSLLLCIWGREYLGISIEVIVLGITYAVQLSQQLWNSAHVFRMAIRALGDAQPMMQIMKEPNKIKDDADAKDLVVSKGVVEFNGVGFSYKNDLESKGEIENNPTPESNPKKAKENETNQDISKLKTEQNTEEVFDNLNILIPAGQSLGLVGHSGSGKTTLTKLLLRFMDVEKGQINIDGMDISKVTQESLHKAISYVPQEPSLFHRTIFENITYGKLDATQEEVINAAKKANAWEFIEKLPNGLDTLTGERGVKLSGGQRQRIIIARAILKNAPILVLDEATSALDTESEQLIQEAMKTMLNGRTSIVIAHRLSTVSSLKRILVMDNGKIIEDGTHSDLLKQKGKYSKLWNKQTGMLKDDD